jgi:hypothetical protein
MCDVIEPDALTNSHAVSRVVRFISLPPWKMLSLLLLGWISKCTHFIDSALVANPHR